MWYRNEERKLSASDTVRGLLYGVEKLIPEINRTYTRRKAAQARNILVEVQKLISQGIEEGIETRR
jgi:hypothetical protein